MFLPHSLVLGHISHYIVGKQAALPLQRLNICDVLNRTLVFLTLQSNDGFAHLPQFSLMLLLDLSHFLRKLTLPLGNTLLLGVVHLFCLAVTLHELMFE